MRNYFFIWIASALILFAGCAENEIENEQPTPEAEGRTLVITASMPDESPQTRLSLTPDTESKDIIVKWKAGDEIRFFFEQGMMIFLEGSPVTLTQQNISLTGKSATFTITIPQEVNQNSNFKIYAIHGAQVDFSAAHGKMNVNVSPVGFSLLSGLNNVPTWGEVTVTPQTDPIEIQFNHLGLLQCLNFKNSSGAALSITPTLVNDGGATWYYKPDGVNVPYYNLLNKQHVYATGTLPTTLPVNIPNGQTVLLAQWVRPQNVNTPQIKLNAQPDVGQPIVSANCKPARSSAMQKGKAYHLYALWDGTNLYFTGNNTFTPPPTGDLMHADGGNNFIGVVYSKGGVDQNVYYNSTQDGNTWLGETSLGTGSEARIAIDGSNHPHVVFTTADHKIAYMKHDGTSWSTVYIVSNNVGSTGECSKPDIDVDGNGYAHISYTDTEGGNPGNYMGANPTDLPNIMYANNTSGSFVKAVAFDGYDTGWDKYSFNKGSRIAVDAAGTTYYIIAHKYGYIPSEGDRYYIAIKAPLSTHGNSLDASDDHHDVYDLEYDGTKAVALYKELNQNRTATIQVQGQQASFIDKKDITTSSVVPHSLSHRCEIVGLSSSNNLFYKYSNTEGSYTDITVKANTEVAAVNKGNTANKFYAVYTDSDDSKIKVKEISTN
ncbi:MAG: hypothetical protein ACOX2D_08250 [Fermentimonas sp.]